ncbi:MAG: uracil phosphoribosyltransferase [Deltaproteobacteria bacterium]|nr:uracil phosphoribosyltransferase [Deltaproteobacteria bacterium]
MFHVVEHPLVQHKLGILRAADTSTAKFREVTREITNLLSYEATKDLDTEEATVQGWAGPVRVRQIVGKKVAVVPILRAGIGMLQGVLDLIPAARVNVVGLYRNEETLEPVQYYKKFNVDIAERLAIVLDPMLATGHSFAATVDMLRAAGCATIRGLCLVGAPEGIGLLERTHPEVEIFAASRDERLNDRGYILPGLGDAGDRLFGTK